MGVRRRESCAPLMGSRACAWIFLLASVLAWAVVPQSAGARSPVSQKVKPKVRLVDGVVDGKDGKPLTGAVVYLKDEKTTVIRTYLTQTDGHFQFKELSLSTDYAVWARDSGKRSKIKFISMFNSKPVLHLKLKIDQAE